MTGRRKKIKFSENMVYSPLRKSAILCNVSPPSPCMKLWWDSDNIDSWIIRVSESNSVELTQLVDILWDKSPQSTFLKNLLTVCIHGVILLFEMLHNASTVSRN